VWRTLARNLRKADRSFAAINRLRSERIDHLLATGGSHVVTLGHARVNGIRGGGWVKTAEDPLEGTSMAASIGRRVHGPNRPARRPSRRTVESASRCAEVGTNGTYEDTDRSR
jgi:hypothetical protein